MLQPNDDGDDEDDDNGGDSSSVPLVRFDKERQVDDFTRAYRKATDDGWSIKRIPGKPPIFVPPRAQSPAARSVSNAHNVAPLPEFTMARQEKVGEEYIIFPNSFYTRYLPSRRIDPVKAVF